MKRGAERYISKSDASDDEIEEVSSSGEGFQKADDSVLATRKIRSLPKRSHTGTPTPSTPTPITPTTSSIIPKFSGFVGFSSPSPTFSFPEPAALSNSTPHSPQPFSFDSSSIKSSVAPTTSPAVKTFASSLNDSKLSSSAPATSPPQPPTPSTSSQAAGVDDSYILEYYRSLRGLNVSLVGAINKAVVEDPFINASEILERYQSLRLSVQEEFEKSASSTDRHVSGTSASAPKQASMPTPPAMFTGFGALSPSTSSTGINSATLPKPSATSSVATTTSGFSFFSPPTATALSTPTNLFGSSTTDPDTSSKPTSALFGQPTTSTPSTPLSFGTSTKSTSPKPFFGSLSSSTANTSVFGTTASSTGSPFGSDKPTTTPSVFGNSSATTGAKPHAFGGFGGFGNSIGGVGSIGNPVGFGFGTPQKTPDSEAPPTTSSTSGFTFGTPVAVEKKSDNGGNGNGNEGDAEGEAKAGTGEGTQNFGLLTNSLHDEEGEGEEQEDTTHAIKLRAFRLKKSDEKGGAGWVELGYGVLRLKKHKGTEARRVLLRNSSTGKININFNLYPGLKPSQTKRTVTFVGHDEGVSQTYSVRLQNEDQASQLKDAMEKEIAFVKVKSGD